MMVGTETGQRAARCLSIVVLLAGPVGDPARAQDLPAIPEGALIRVWAPSHGLDAQRSGFVSWQQASLAAVLEPGKESVDVPLGSITRLEVFEGRSAARGAVNGALLGGAALGIVGLMVGRAQVSGCDEFLCDVESLDYLAGGFVAGVLIGAPIGAMRPQERWRALELSPDAGFPQPRFNRGRAVLLLLPVALFVAAVAG